MSEPTPEELAEFLRGHNLSQAQAHDIDGARAILRLIASDLEEGALDGVYRRWLVEALREIASGGDANKALLLAGAKGRNYSVELVRFRRNWIIWRKMNNLKQETPVLSFHRASCILALDYSELGDQAIRKIYLEFTKQPNYDDLFKKLRK